MILLWFVLLCGAPTFSFGFQSSMGSRKSFLKLITVSGRVAFWNPDPFSFVFPSRHVASYFRFASQNGSLFHSSAESISPESTSSQPPPLRRETYRTEKYTLASGVNMTVQFQTRDPTLKTTIPRRPPIIFLHGSFHGSWCWTERFFPYFAAKGYTVIAPNWRGTRGTYAGDGVKKVKIMEHVADLECFLSQVVPLIAGVEYPKPILVAHSFGGLAIMKFFETRMDQISHVGGMVTMCSVPPSGNGKMTLRYLRRSWMDSWKITAGFALKRCLTNQVLCRQLFFGGDKKIGDKGEVIEDYGISDSDIQRYQTFFDEDSKSTIDLMDLAKQLPSFTAVDGKAPFVERLPPCLVMGATDDMIVDREGLAETATYFGLEGYQLVDSPHDVMLGTKWRNAADALDAWISTTIKL